jgi:Ca-activated chloride channel family protein
MKKIIVFLILITIIAAGCNQEITEPVGAYTTVIGKLYNEDMALNHDIKYIAVDTSLINNLSEEQKSELLKEIEKYGYIVLDMTFDKLEEQGYIEELYFKEGILFNIEDKPMSGNAILMNVSKWRSGLGAIGYNDLKVEYKNGNWKITKTESAWIS